MRNRTKARQIALQFLYQVDLFGKEILVQLERFLYHSTSNLSIREYARELVTGCVTHWDSINAKITADAKNWQLPRMAVVDRTILRIAIYELSHCQAVPRPVVLNEAIELGKSFSTEHSGAFINGILDQIIKKLEAPSPDQSPPCPEKSEAKAK